MSAGYTNDDFVAAAFVNADAAAPAFFSNRGFNTLVRNAAGNYSLTLDQGVDATECMIQITCGEAQAASGLTTYGVVHTSDTVKTISTMQEQAAGAASAAADVDFYIEVKRLA